MCVSTVWTNTLNLMRPALILSCRHAGIVEQTSAEHWISLIVNLLHMYCMLLAIRKSAVVFMLLANTPAMMPINSMQLLHLQTYPRFLVAAFTNPAMSGVHLCRGVLPFLLQTDGSAPSCTRKQAIVALPLPGGMWYSSRTWSRDVAHHNIGVDRHSVSTYGGLIASGLFTSRSARSARTAGTKIALRFPRLFVCASALITCAIYYIIRYYATAVYSSVWRFAGQATANEGSFVLPRWRKCGR